MERGSCLKGGNGGRRDGPLHDAKGWRLLCSDLGRGQHGHQRGREWSPQTPRASDMPIRNSGASEAQLGPRRAPWHGRCRSGSGRKLGWPGPGPLTWTTPPGAVV